MKKLLVGLMLSLLAVPGWSQTYYNIYGPAAGIQKSSGATPFNTAAVSSDVTALWSGTCSTTTFLRGDGSCAVPTGTTVSANPSATLGLTAVNGTATTFMTSDSAPALSQAISPTWSGTHTFSNAITVNGGGSSLKGGVVITAPASGTALSIAGLQGATNTQFSGPNTGVGWNVVFQDTTNAIARGFIGIGTNTVGGAAVADFGIAPGASGSVVIGTANGAAIGTRFGPNGNVTVNAPSSGNTLVSTAVANGRPANFIGASTSGQSFGLLVNSGTTSADDAIEVINQAGTVQFLRIFGDGHGALGPTNLLGLSWTAAGDVTVAAPSSGTALTANAVANSRPAAFVGSNTSGQSFGPVINSGTTSADDAFFITNQSGSTGFFRIFGDGGATAGTPTGGDKGLGTLNTSGNIFINNVSVRMTSVMIPATCTVNGACTLTANNGFASVTRTGTGAYTATLATNYSSTPVCLVGSVIGSNVQNQTTLNTIGTTGATVSTYANTGAGTATNLADAGFSLICQGN